MSSFNSYIKAVRVLSFPTYEFKVIRKNEKPYIFDVVRKQYVALLPEEWVRQHLIHYLINEKKFPKGLMKVEHHIKVNQLNRFTDLTVFNRLGKPSLIAECKAPNVQINAFTFEQISNYGHVLKAPYFLLTNGLQHFVYYINRQTQTFQFLNDVPNFDELKA